MAAKTSWHRYVTKLRHSHPMYKLGLRPNFWGLRRKFETLISAKDKLTSCNQQVDGRRRALRERTRPTAAPDRQPGDHEDRSEGGEGAASESTPLSPDV